MRWVIAREPALLTRRYRRLLACYPAEHRQDHEQEMLDVLMTGARPGQRRPGPAESVDLIWGAVAIRLRPSSPDPGWRPALALFSVIFPLALLALSTAWPLLHWSQSWGQGMLINTVLVFVQSGQLVVAALVVLRLRRSATAVSAVSLAALLVFSLISQQDWHLEISKGAFIIAAYGLETAALAASLRLPREPRILTWKRAAAAIAAGLTGGGLLTAYEYPRLPPVQGTVIRLAGIAVLVVIVAVMALASRTSRRVLLLVAVACYFYLGVPMLARLNTAYAIALTWPPLLAMAGVTLLASRRSRHGRRRLTAGAPDDLAR